MLWNHFMFDRQPSHIIAWEVEIEIAHNVHVSNARD